MSSDVLVDGPAWYLIFTKTRQERVAEQNLARQGYPVFLPLISARKRLRGRFIDVVEAMFPRYLFIQLSAGIDNWAPVRSTWGVASIVRFGMWPSRVPEDLISELQQRCDADGIARGLERSFVPGERVRIVDGPFVGYEAIFSAHDGKERVRILLDIAGRETVVSMPEAALAFS